MISDFGALVQAHFIRPPSVLAMAQQYPCSSMPHLPFTVSTCLMVESVQEWQSCSSCHCCCCAELHPNPNRFEFIHPLLQSKHVRCEFDDVVKLQWALTASIQTLKLTVYYVDHVTSLRRLLTALAGSLQLKRIVEKEFCNFWSDFMGTLSTSAYTAYMCKQRNPGVACCIWLWWACHQVWQQDMFRVVA